MIRNADISGVSIGVAKERRQRKAMPVEVLGILYFVTIALAGVVLVWQPAAVAELGVRRQQLEATLNDLKLRNEDLKKTVAAMESLDYVEHEARVRLGMVDPREVRTFTVNEYQSPQTVVTAERESAHGRGILSLLSRIAEVFGSKEATAKGKR